MHISQIRIRNFRGLEEIEFHPKDGVNVLVGPNAVGKTSILEALRLTKALLSPRYREEVGHVLISLGASTPHMLFGEQQIDFSALAGNETRPLEIAFDIALSTSEKHVLDENSLQLSQALVRSRIGQERQSQLDLIQFMSSPQGQELLRTAQAEIQRYLQELMANSSVRLGLLVQPAGNGLQITSKDPVAQLILQGLEGACPPQAALFTYFPADRALPSGEVNIQLGSADLQQQVHSHWAQPTNKYSRLKQIIVNAFVLGEESRRQLEQSFNAIFSQLLPGKKLEAIRQKPTGALSVLIRDERSQRIFDIDSMSSGEKGLILSFLLLRGGAAQGGIVLLDEPELHLNPAVCSRLVPFLHTHVVQPLNLQVLLCTHSAEILSTALQRDDCHIFHVRTARDITPVDRRDRAEVFDILRRLGLNSMDVVSWQGTIFLEGDDDVDLLSAGFPDLLAGYQLKSLGGRAEVEKDISRLQEAERRGEIERLHTFIFDRDRRPTALSSSALVRVLQWDRYCIENYLTDESILFDVLQRFAQTKPASKGELRASLKEMALSQTTDEAVRRAYASREPENCGLRPKEVIGRPTIETATSLFDRLERARNSLKDLDRSTWTESFMSDVDTLSSTLRADWDDTWRKECDGKRLLRDIQARYQLRVASSFLKAEVVREMRNQQSDDWKILRTLVSQAVSVTTTSA